MTELGPPGFGPSLEAPRLRRSDPLAQPARAVGADAVGPPSAASVIARTRGDVWALQRSIRQRGRPAGLDVERPHAWGSEGTLAVGASPRHEVELGGLLFRFVFRLDANPTGGAVVQLRLNGAAVTIVETGTTSLTLGAGVVRAVATLNGDVAAPGDYTDVNVTAAPADATNPSAFAYFI